MRLFDGGDVAPRRLSLIKTSGGVGGGVDMFDSSRGGARVIRPLDFVTHRHTFQILFRQIKLRGRFHNSDDILYVYCVCVFQSFSVYYERYFVTLKTPRFKKMHRRSHTM